MVEGPVGWPARIAAFLLGGGVLAMPMALYGSMLERVIEGQRQQRALTNIRPLAGTLPLALHNWAIDPHFADLLVRWIVRERPELILECGSGVSTVIMAAALKELNSGRLISLDHEDRFAERTRERLTRRGLDRWAEVVTARLGSHEIEGRIVPWYTGYESWVEEASIDMLVVDGPPKGTGARARYPAVPLLRGYLAPDCLILLDDGRRRDERRTARDWSHQLPGSLEYVEGGRGVWLLRSRQRPPRVSAMARAESG